MRESNFKSSHFCICLSTSSSTSVSTGPTQHLPIIPLDGGRMSQYFFNRYSKRDCEKQAIMLSLITAIVVGLYLFRASGDFLIIFLFGYLAYMNFQALQPSAAVDVG